MKNSPRAQTMLRASLLVFAVLSGGAAYQFSQARLADGGSFSLRSQWWLLILALGFFAVGAITLWLLSFGQSEESIHRTTRKIADFLLRWRVFWPIGLIGGMGLYLWLIFGPAGDFLTPLFPRLLIYALGVLGGAVSLKLCCPRRGFAQWLSAASLGLAALHQITIFLQGVSTYPFSLGWSEASRYYYASLFFSERLYGFSVPPSVLHPTRYALQSLPFLLPGLPLWAHRLWQALLWIGVTWLTATLLARRTVSQGPFTRWLMVAWAFLFLLVGPVYYHLQVAALIVLWGFNARKPIYSLGVVALASAWAGVSRVNWYPVPAMLAIALYVLERPLLGDQVGGRPPKAVARYLLPPLVWGVGGLLAAFGAQAIYVLWSGNDPKQFASSFTSDLLWNRLWPNATYPPGILAAIVGFSLPFGLLMFFRWRQGRGWGHTLRWSLILLMLLALFAGGLVVSVKIGGGSNLHNMDAYLMLLLVVCAYLFGGRFVSGAHPPQGSAAVRIPTGLAVALICAPILYLVPTGGPQRLPDPADAEDALRRITRQVMQVVAEGGEVLFVTQRQLVMFETIPGVSMIPEYEVVFLMEMAMANQRDYLAQFYADLASHRFGLIVIDPLPEDEKSPDLPFGEEHNAWLWRVAEPIRAEYGRLAFFRGIGVDLYVPKP